MREFKNTPVIRNFFTLTHSAKILQDCPGETDAAFGISDLPDPMPQ